MSAGPPILRPARIEDVPGCLDIFYEANEELLARVGQPMMPRNPAALGWLFRHLIETDPERAWVAETDAADLTAFGLAHRRGATWFLAFLFVRPELQARGIGRLLLEACLGDDAPTSVRSDARPTRWATCVDSIQPVSTALYAGFGMLPRVPLYALTGRVDRDRPLASSHRLVGTPLTELAASDHRALGAELDSLDVGVLGYAHPQDHAWLEAVGREGHLFRDGATGATVGYGYVHRSGRIGPVAVRDEHDLPEVVDHLIGAVPTPDAWLAFVPGPSSALVPLMRAGLRIDGAPGLYCATDGGPVFARYLPINFAVL